MTPERLKQLRFLANFAAYHVPGDERREHVKGEAGDDMLELCDAVAVNTELLDALLEAEDALAWYADDGKAVAKGALATVRAAIAKAEGR